MDETITNVRQFHRQSGATIADSPTLLACRPETAGEIATAIRTPLTQCQTVASDDSGLLSRLCLALAELAEWAEAHVTGDLVAAVDAWGDRMYVLLGDAVAAGLPASAIFDEVHRSNMSKTAVRTGNLGKGTKTADFRQARLQEILFPQTGEQTETA